MKALVKAIWSAGHSVGMVKDADDSASICDQIVEEFTTARKTVKAIL